MSRIAILTVAGAVALGAVGFGWWTYSGRLSNPSDVGGDRVATAGPEDPHAFRGRVEVFCGACHAFPPPDSFPRANWDAEVRRGFDFYRKSDMKLDPPTIESVVTFYKSEAPETFAVIPPTKPDTGLKIGFKREDIPGPRPEEPTAISFVGLTNLSNLKTPDLLACDMASGELLIRSAKTPDGPATVLASDLAHPAHAEVADLDGDGIKDIIVSDLGVPMPSDERKGRVLWMKGKKEGGYETIVIASGLGRVCDAQPSDFDGDGDLDLVVAVFGWHRAGEIIILEQKKTPSGPPDFVRRVIDDRHGTIHVPVVDLNGDGKPDFVAIITQEHEKVVAFLNEGGGKFAKKELFAAPHPAFGSSGIQMSDIDGDGDLDVVLSNGDVYDSPLLKPYHGVSWLENKGLDRPFERHALGPVYGSHRALAGDIDGDGDIDVVATSFLGEPFYGAMRKEVNADAVVIFEQVKRGEFVRHAIEHETCDYPTIVLGDVDGDGRMDIVAGRFRNFQFSQSGDPLSPGVSNAPIVLWKNLGPLSGK